MYHLQASEHPGLFPTTLVKRCKRGLVLQLSAQAVHYLGYLVTICNLDVSSPLRRSSLVSVSWNFFRVASGLAARRDNSEVAIGREEGSGRVVRGGLQCTAVSGLRV